jgi:sodium-independent sulfate anion transporter 11
MLIFLICSNVAALGRTGGYRIDCNQELLAMGVINVAGPFFGAYSTTGACARMALTSKSGARTPLAGVTTATVVLVSIYALTNLFYWIPSSSLAAIIIHAVVDLIAAPSTVYRVWRISPMDFCVWLGTLLSVAFSSIATGVYFGVFSSLLILLYRIAHPRDQFLGKVQLESESGDQRESREVYVPMKPNGINNPSITVLPPAPGIIVYRLEEGFLYPNSSSVNSTLVTYVKENMRQGKDFNNVKLQDRVWCDGGPRNRSVLEQARNERKSWLHAIVLDLSSV